MGDYLVLPLNQLPVQFLQTLLLPFALMSLSLFSAQENPKRTLAFYNVENLFDIRDDSLVFDNARTPKGYYRWTGSRYASKINALAKVISKIGARERGATPDIIGLCEVENAGVLMDLVAHPLLGDSNYGIIHQDSPDERGIDVAFIYKQDAFMPSAFSSNILVLRDDELQRDRTRDQLVITGWLGTRFIGCIINHWPSRRGGQTRSAPFRLQAAQLNRKLVDSLRREDPDILIFNMGDFNDNPNDISMQYILSSPFSDQPDLYNPMLMLYRKGYGTLAYRDQWSLFDQILVDSKLLQGDTRELKIYRIGIFNPSELVTPKGRYKGYPFSTYSAGRYQGGASDHFPVYIILSGSSL